MSFNEEELGKIEKATSGWFKRPARTAISQALSVLQPKIVEAKNLGGDRKQTVLKELVQEATSARQKALQGGARSYGHPDWAAAAACESWLHELVGGTESSIARIEVVVDRLQRR